jgi:Xaa-Pro aminopeptidase
MIYRPPAKELYTQNRIKFNSLLKPGSIAIFNSNDQMPTNADGTMPFRQNNDLLYLTGIDQEETTLLLFPDHRDESKRTILFIKETSELIAIWEGKKLTKEQATQLSGIDQIFWASEFEEVFKSLVLAAEHIYLNANEHARAAAVVETRDDRFRKWCHEQFPDHTYERSAPLLHTLRAVKSQAEIDMIQMACDITEKGFRRVLASTKPGIMEYEIQAEYIHEFLVNKSRGFAYEPIIASGLNACVLHYIENDNHCKDGEVILMDVGAEYGNYNADMTRCIPANGRFTNRQKDVYQAVLRIKEEAQKLLFPGNLIPEYHKEVGKLMEQELLNLGLLDKTDIKNQKPNQPAYKKYFMHGTSHHLGLDVHDVGDVNRKIEPGMVFTVEPGIYIPKEKLGIRLEDNIVVQEHGFDNLMRNIPIEVDEIEDLMNG